MNFLILLLIFTISILFGGAIFAVLDWRYQCIPNWVPKLLIILMIIVDIIFVGYLITGSI